MINKIAALLIRYYKMLNVKLEIILDEKKTTQSSEFTYNIVHNNSTLHTFKLTSLIERYRKPGMLKDETAEAIVERLIEILDKKKVF